MTAEFLVPVKISGHAGAGAYLRLPKRFARLLPRTTGEFWLGLWGKAHTACLVVAFEESERPPEIEPPHVGECEDDEIRWVGTIKGNPEGGRGLKMYIPKDIVQFVQLADGPRASNFDQNLLVVPIQEGGSWPGCSIQKRPDSPSGSSDDARTSS